MLHLTVLWLFFSEQILYHLTLISSRSSFCRERLIYWIIAEHACANEPYNLSKENQAVEILSNENIKYNRIRLLRSLWVNAKVTTLIKCFHYINHLINWKIEMWTHSGDNINRLFMVFWSEDQTIGGVVTGLLVVLGQAWATSSPRATCGPPSTLRVRVWGYLRLRLRH